MKILLPLFLFASSLLSAKQILLDDVMSREEQRKTGINKLSATQKIELEKWINETFVLKAQSEEKPQGSLYLSLNIDNGQKLQLSDNSVWEIAPGDVQKASAWITPFPIEISPSGDPSYPSLITNKTTGESVKARRWVQANTPS